MPKVSANKVRAFVEKAKMGKYKTPDNDANYSGKISVPQSQTVTNSKADERNFTPAEEDQEKLDKSKTDWMGYDYGERSIQDMEEKQRDAEFNRQPASAGKLSDAQRRRFTLNLAKRKK